MTSLANNSFEALGTPRAVVHERDGNRHLVSVGHKAVELCKDEYVVYGPHALEQFVETLFEETEATGDIGPALDAVAIIYRVPDHFDTPTDGVIEHLAKKTISDHHSREQALDYLERASYGPELLMQRIERGMASRAVAARTIHDVDSDSVLRAYLDFMCANHGSTEPVTLAELIARAKYCHFDDKSL